MKVWLAFIVLSFVFAARAARRERNDRAMTLLGACVLVAALFYVGRGI